MTVRRGLVALLALLMLAGHPVPAFAAGGSGLPGATPPPMLLTTPWTHLVSTHAPLPDYPRPQLVRGAWLNLNGLWQYGQGRAGAPPPLHGRLAESILVPYPVQAPLSGIARSDTRGWYRRTFTVPPGWRGQHLLLHFGAVAWFARIYVNGRAAGIHRGEFAPFTLDVTRLLRRRGPNQLLVGFWDPMGAADEPVGKQIPGSPYGFYHTASSGIWQTVWLEPVSATYLSGVALVPDLAHGRLTIAPSLVGDGHARLRVQAIAGGRIVARASGPASRPIEVAIPHPHAWSPVDPYLYGLRLSVIIRHHRVDQVSSYFAMRDVSLGRVGGATRILLNGKFVFQSGALEQGYWPDGIYTPAADAALRADVAVAKDLGYNMIRVHAKVQPDRFYFWADRLGILVWQDMPNLPIVQHRPPTAAGKAEYKRELTAVVEALRNHPSLVTWIPFNESWGAFDVSAITRTVRRLDAAALVDSDSGSADCCSAAESSASDMRDTHLYSGPWTAPADWRAAVIGEYGGVLPYPPVGHAWPGTLTSIGSPVLAWGPAPVIGELRRQYAELRGLMQTRGLSAAIFTELTSAEQELGILTYDRRVLTLPPSLLRRLNGALIATSQHPARLRPPPPAIPPGASGAWSFDERSGTTAGDSSGAGHTLLLEHGAGWAAGHRGSAVSFTAPGQFAVATAPLIDTGHSFTVSAWLRAAIPRQSAAAVSEPGPDGSAFSLGIATGSQGFQSVYGLIGRTRTLVPGIGTWWTFVAPAASNCTAAVCGVRANLRYEDGRFVRQTTGWHFLTGVYDRGTGTLTLYLDGIAADVEWIGQLPAARGPTIVGAGAGDYPGADSFIGALDDLRIYPRALGAREAWQLFAAESR